MKPNMPLLLLFLISMSRIGGDLLLCAKPFWRESPDYSAAPAPLYKCKVHSLFKKSTIVLMYICSKTRFVT